jgi:hypothetical protein
MKIFKRPMFRKGGEAMTGIMENISPRQNLSNGTEFEKAMAQVNQVLGPVQKNDPLTDFLLLYGPSLAKSNLPGGTVRNIIGAADDPLKQTLASRRAQRERERARKLTALQLAEAEKDRQLKREISEDRLEAMKLGKGLDLLPTFVDVYDGDLTLATNRNKYETQGLKIKGMNTFKEKFKGLVGGDQHGDINSNAFLNKKNLGNVYYDITDNKFKRIRRTTEGFGVEVIDIDTFDPEVDKKSIVKKPKPSGLFGQKTKPDKTFKEVFNLQDTEVFDPLGGS